jgi:hypothetical protein
MPWTLLNIRTKISIGDSGHTLIVLLRRPRRRRRWRPPSFRYACSESQGMATSWIDSSGSSGCILRLGTIHHSYYTYSPLMVALQSDPKRRREYDSLYSTRSRNERTAQPDASQSFFNAFSGMFAGAGPSQSTGEDFTNAQRPNADGVFGDVFEEVRSRGGQLQCWYSDSP